MIGASSFVGGCCGGWSISTTMPVMTEKKDLTTTLVELKPAALHRPGQAAALLDPQRVALLRALMDGPDSASGLARRFSLPRQRVNYHLRLLEREGLLELVETRRRRNCWERVLRATASALRLVMRTAGRSRMCRSRAVTKAAKWRGKRDWWRC